MFKNYDADTDFGMDSPISLNSIDDTEQFYTFSAGDNNRIQAKKNSKKVPVLKVNLKSLLDQQEIQVISVNYSTIKKTENISSCTGPIKKNLGYSVIRNAKVTKKCLRSPLREKNSPRVVGCIYKSLSPFQRKLSLHVNKNAPIRNP